MIGGPKTVGFVAPQWYVVTSTEGYVEYAYKHLCLCSSALRHSTNCRLNARSVL